ncbi:MAG: hypothetical protein RLZZ209_979 [Bacteroidota bacterium]
MHTCFRLKFLNLCFVLLLAVSTAYAQNSVLAAGKWIKVGITQSGLYQISPAFLAKYNQKSSQIGVYGHEIGQLPQSNAAPRPVDLQAPPFTISV